MKRKRILIPIAVVTALILLSGGVFVFLQKFQATKSSQSSPAQESNLPVATDSLPAQADAATNNGQAAASAADSTTQLQKPTLTKSAGTAPKNVPVDFTCWAPDGYFCRLVLKNQSSGQAIELEKKKIATDKTGQSTTNWTWTTIAGTWLATATLSDSTTNTAISEPQTIVVKP